MTPAAPIMIPNTTASHIYRNGNGGSMPKWKIGSRPNTTRLTIVATRAAAMAGARTTLEKFRWSSSKAKMAPASGALNAAARPALAPAVIKYRSSMRDRPRARLIPWAVTAPSCIDGPSRPRDSPRPIPSIPPASLTQSTLSQRSRTTPRMIPFTCGIPLPDASGSCCFRRYNTYAAISRNTNHTVFSTHPACISRAYTCSRSRVPASRHQRKKLMTMPLSRPTHAPSTNRRRRNRGQ